MNIENSILVSNGFYTFREYNSHVQCLLHEKIEWFQESILGK